jgi:hypothetical protein
MTISIWAAGARRPITSIRVMVGGVARPIRSIRVRVGNQLRLVYSTTTQMQASASPDFVSGEERSEINAIVTSMATRAVVSGGRLPFSYSWVAEGFNGTITANNPTMAQTSFSANVEPRAQVIGGATCTITDADGNETAASVAIELNNNGSGYQP